VQDRRLPGTPVHILLWFVPVDEIWSFTTSADMLQVPFSPVRNSPGSGPTLSSAKSALHSARLPVKSVSIDRTRWLFCLSLSQTTAQARPQHHHEPLQRRRAARRWYRCVCLVLGRLAGDPALERADDRLPPTSTGPEVTREAVKVLQAVAAARSDVAFDIKEHDFGGCAIDNHNDPLPPSTLEACKKSVAIILGE